MGGESDTADHEDLEGPAKTRRDLLPTLFTVLSDDTHLSVGQVLSSFWYGKVIGG